MVNDGRSDNEADDGTVSYTIRNIPGYLDYIITSQAASAGKPKTTWLRELLVDTFRDDISNFIRKSGLVASLDAELFEYLRASADPNGYSGLLPGINEGYISFLNLKNDDDLKRILFNNAPYLRDMARVGMAGISYFRRGLSLELALFAELAAQDWAVIRMAWEKAFYSTQPDAENQFYKNIDSVRLLKNLSSLVPGFVTEGSFVTLYSYRPASYGESAWRVQVMLKDGHNGAVPAPVPRFPGWVIIADPGYTTSLSSPDGTGPAYFFRNNRCEFHVYAWHAGEFVTDENVEIGLTQQLLACIESQMV
ncbi:MULTISPECIES: hypothetical protein [Klebsiella/Raoultella group]|uniref:hypothetical protein n=1 Tax=Klebsiella/Raoultella group TaxID=2890311 RepID=UPI001F2A2FFF|nr:MULTISPECIES: hypothetical protein [Klebsiella]MDS7802813.1 hypothetical protein [Klebsiella michiganensis]UHA83638.1 hypothetical protein EENBGKKG_00038 [Klebsiella oxytoca]